MRSVCGLRIGPSALPTASAAALLDACTALCAPPARDPALARVLPTDSAIPVTVSVKLVLSSNASSRMSSIDDAEIVGSILAGAFSFFFNFDRGAGLGFGFALISGISTGIGSGSGASFGFFFATGFGFSIGFILATGFGFSIGFFFATGFGFSIGFFFATGFSLAIGFGCGSAFGFAAGRAVCGLGLNADSGASR